MRYMLLICDDTTAPPPTGAEMDALIQGHRRFMTDLQAAGKMAGGHRLRPEADATRIRLKAVSAR